MLVYGEAYLFINFWMDFLSLLLAACLRRARFHGLQAVAGAALGAAYALLARTGGAFFRGFPALLAAMLAVTMVSFGRTGPALFPWVAASALLLCGLADTMLQCGVSAAGVLLLCGLAALGFCLAQRGQRPVQDGAWVLHVTYRGKSAALPAIRDSGNLLRDGVTGQPVIVTPESALRRLMPQGVRPGDYITLPRGWRLLPIRTAAGSGLVMCFRPDAVSLTRDGKVRQVDATIAVTEYGDAALVPEEVFFR